MRILNIKVERLPGIRVPFELDGLSRELNVVLGPNGSGKSSIRRLLERVFWPPSKRGSETDAVVVFEDAAGGKLVATVAFGTVSWQSDGIPASSPEFPVEHLKGCFALDLRELMSGDSKDGSELARDIRTRLAGFDFEGLKKGFAPKRWEGRKEAEAVREAERKLRDLDREREDLARGEEEAGRLEERLDAAKNAESVIAVLKVLRNAVEAKRRLGEIELELSEFPEGMDKLSPEDSERLKRFASELGDCRKSIADAAAETAELEKRLAGLSVPDNPPSDEILSAETARADALIRRDEKLSDIRLRLAAAESALSAALEDLGRGNGGKRNGGGNGNERQFPLGTLNGEFVSALSKIVEERAEAKSALVFATSELEALSAKSSAASEKPVDVERRAERLSRMAETLRDWLALPVGASSGAGRVGEGRGGGAVAASAVGAVLVVAGIGLAFVSPWFAVLAGLGVGTVAGALLVGRSRGLVGVDSDVAAVELDAERRSLERKYAEVAGGGDGIVWERSEVSVALRGIAEDAAEAREAAKELERVSQRLEDAEANLKSKKKALEEFDEKLRERLSELGLDVPASDLETRVLAERLKNILDAAGGEAEARGELDALVEEVERVKRGLSEFLGKHGRPVPEDTLEIKAEVDRLRNDIAARHGALEHLERARRTKSEHEKRLGDLERERGSWLDARSLPAESPETELSIRLRGLEKYAGLVEEKRDRESGFRMASKDLDGDAMGRVDSVTIREIDGEIADLDALAGERDGINEELTLLRGKIAEAERGAERGMALSELEARRYDLDLKREEVSRKLAAETLLADVEEEYREKNKPEVVSRAADYFRSFTRGLYDLRLGSSVGADAFSAYHNSEERGYSLEELSDGTRIQLLLAVKMAFADQVDRDAALPLILDEPLTTSDPVRFQAVAEALAVISGKRQIVYFSSDPSDASKWLSAAESAGKAAPKLFDLGNIRKLADASSEPADYAVEPPPAYPAPEGMSPEDYAVALGVPKIDIFAPVGSWHVFHAARPDLELCHEILSLYRVETIGQWRAISKPRAGGESVLRAIGADAAARLDARIALMESLRRLLLVGRGRPLSRKDIFDCPHVSDSYKGRFADLAEELKWDAAAFMDAVDAGADARVKRFRKKAELREYLEELGCIATEEPIDDSEIAASARAENESAFSAGTLSKEDIWSILDGTWRGDLKLN